MSERKRQKEGEKGKKGKRKKGKLSHSYPINMTDLK